MAIRKHFLKTNKFKTNVICILIRRNLLKEEVTKNSLIANILKNGSEKYKSIKEINNKIENMYGAIFDIQIIKKSEEQLIQFYFEFVDNDEKIELLDEAMEFLKEIIFMPKKSEDGFGVNYFNIEKENLKEIINSKINNKSEYAKEKCLEEMCKNEPFGIDGDGYIECLDNINNKELFTHYKKILDESPLEIIVMGNFDNGQVDNVIEKYFTIKQKNITETSAPNNIYEKKETNKIEDYADISQGKISIGLRAKEALKGKELYSLILFSSILGGGADSKLFKNVREKENLCYYIYSFVYRFKSIIFIQSGVEEEHLNKATEIILRELEEFINGNFKTSDLEKAKNNLIKDFENIEDSQSKTIDFHTSQILANDESTVDDILKLINKISVNDILKTGEDIYVDTIFHLKNLGGIVN